MRKNPTHPVVQNYSLATDWTDERRFEEAMEGVNVIILPVPARTNNTTIQQPPYYNNLPHYSNLTTQQPLYNNNPQSIIIYIFQLPIG